MEIDRNEIEQESDDTIMNEFEQAINNIVPTDDIDAPTDDNIIETDEVIDSNTESQIIDEVPIDTTAPTVTETALAPTTLIDNEYGCMTNKGLGTDPSDSSTNPLVHSITDNSFTDSMNQVKMNVLAQASAEDTNFTNEVKQNLVQAAVKHTKLESKKADYANQTLEYESQVLGAKQKATEHRVAEDKWYNKEKRREFHYNGVKPIMDFVGIRSPMNLFMLYFLTFILTPFYLISKLFKGTIGALVVGAEDENRSKQAKGFLWTILVVVVLLLVAAVIYLFLKWQGIA